MSVDVCKELMSTVKNGYPNSLSYSWQQGSDEQVQEQKEKFITATNNLQATGENINKLKRGFQVFYRYIYCYFLHHCLEV